MIGGGSVYTAPALPVHPGLYTRVDAVAEGADTFFPNLDKLPGWEVECISDPVEENGLTYQFVDYINKNI